MSFISLFSVSDFALAEADGKLRQGSFSSSAEWNCVNAGGSGSHGMRCCQQSFSLQVGRLYCTKLETCWARLEIVNSRVRWLAFTVLESRRLNWCPLSWNWISVLQLYCYLNSLHIWWLQILTVIKNSGYLLFADVLGAFAVGTVIQLCKARWILFLNY